MGCDEKWLERERWLMEREWEQDYLPNLPHQRADLDLYTHAEMIELEDIEDDGAPRTEAMQKAIDAIGAAVRVGVKK